MAYKIKNTIHPETELKRTIQEQIDKSLEYLEDYKNNLDKTVFEIRKNMKKIRAVLRLIRYSIPKEHYQDLNIFYRDIGRKFAPMRNAKVHVDTLKIIDKQVDGKPVAPAIEEAFKSLYEDSYDTLIKNDRFFIITKNELGYSKKRIDALSLEEEGFELIEKGLKKVYKKGKKAFHKAKVNPEPEFFHDWRKRVKYLWYHLRILQNTWKPVLKGYNNSLHKISDLLGDNHDLDELKKVMHDYDQMKFISTPDKERLIKVIDNKRFAIQAKIWAVAEKIYAEKPGDFTNRMSHYWEAEKEYDLQFA